MEKLTKLVTVKGDEFKLVEFEDPTYGLMIDVYTKEGAYVDEFIGSLEDKNLKDKLTIMLEIKYFV